MDLSLRVTRLNDCADNTKGRYVMYWMQMFKRASHNYALNFAIEMANERGLPLLVYEGLKYYYPWASDRIHTFILEGVAEKKVEFERRGIRYLFYLQRHGRDPKNTVTRLAKDAVLLVTDDYPCFITPEHNQRIAELELLVFAVDANGMLPMSAFPKEEYAAYTLRPKMNRLLPHASRRIGTPRLKVSHAGLDIESPETKVTGENIANLVSQCDIDHSVKPSKLYQGGTTAGRKRLRHFADRILPHYDETRNEPSVDGSSRLSRKFKAKKYIEWTKSLECAALSALSPAAAWRRDVAASSSQAMLFMSEQHCDKSQRTKAPTRRRTPRS